MENLPTKISTPLTNLLEEIKEDFNQIGSVGINSSRLNFWQKVEKNQVTKEQVSTLLAHVPDSELALYSPFANIHVSKDSQIT